VHQSSFSVAPSSFVQYAYGMQRSPIAFDWSQRCAASQFSPLVSRAPIHRQSSDSSADASSLSQTFGFVHRSPCVVPPLMLHQLSASQDGESEVKPHLQALSFSAEPSWLTQ
jgi:hypothetical protein